MAEQTTETKRRKILVGADNSILSERAFDFFTSEVLREGDEIMILSVCEGHDTAQYVPLNKPEEMNEEQYKQMCDITIQKQKELKEKFEEKIRQLSTNNIVSMIEFKSGKIGETICQEALNCHADMIVLGSRGLGTVRRTFLGSNSDYVLHHAHIPVMIVPKSSHE